jgi:hypothetical protein
MCAWDVLKQHETEWRQVVALEVAGSNPVIHPTLHAESAGTGELEGVPLTPPGFRVMTGTPAARRRRS